MIQVNVAVDYQGQIYHTNVLANKDADQDQIMQLALRQIEQQWLDREE